MSTINLLADYLDIEPFAKEVARILAPCDAGSISAMDSLIRASAIEF